jgi:hypothetical protein
MDGYLSTTQPRASRRVIVGRAMPGDSAVS